MVTASALQLPKATTNILRSLQYQRSWVDLKSPSNILECALRNSEFLSESALHATVSACFTCNTEQPRWTALVEMTLF